LSPNSKWVIVAPGIAEALIATAFGLFAAIPATIAYNRLSSQIGDISHQYTAFIEKMKEVKAVHKYAKTSAFKARLVADQIRSKSVEEALNILSFSNKKASVLVKKVLNSAISNAEFLK
jgi:hypothetical protein